MSMERGKAVTVIAKFLENRLTTSNQQEMTEALLKALSDMYKMADIEDIVIKSTQDGTNYRDREVTE